MHSANIWNAQRGRNLAPERHLWIAVLATAIKDSRNTQSEGHHEAIDWLTTEENRDRELVCEFAGFLEGDRLECTWHGAQFDVCSGRATSLPAIRPVKTFNVEIRDSDIYIDVG